MSAPSFRTPLGRARGLGSAKEGVGHHIAQRVTALALAVLLPWFVVSAAFWLRAGHDGAVAWIGQPWNAIGLILLAVAAFQHMRLGLQVVIEDYIGRAGTRQALLVLNTFVTFGLVTAVVLAVLKIWIGAGA